MKSVVTQVDGLGASWGVGASEDRFIRYYAGEGRGGFCDGLRYELGAV